MGQKVHVVIHKEDKPRCRRNRSGTVMSLAA